MIRSTLAILALSTLPLGAQERVMIVLDGSGSMWGRVDGRTKIEIARDAVRDIVTRWEGEGTAQLGLTAYGHRRKGDCSDIEVMVDTGPGTAATIGGLLPNITPTGKTPLSAAVIQAAEALRYEEEKATVILVSDGIETCNMNTCEVGAALEAAGVDFTAHVIGFDVSADADRAQLKCLADRTGGSFTTASNADELGAALDSLGQFDADLIVPGVVEASFPFDVTWNGGNHGGDGIALIRKGDPAMEFASYAQHNGRNPVVLRAPDEPGDYEAVYLVFPYEVAKRRILARAPVQIVPLRPSISAPETVKAGERFELTWRGPETGGDGFAISVAGSEDFEREVWTQHNNKNPVKMRAPKQPGTYEIRYITNPYKIRERLVVARRMLVVE